MSFRLVHELAADGVLVAVACRVLHVSPSGYYEWRGRPPSIRAVADEALSAQIAEIHVMSRGTYGVPRVHAELRLGRGVHCGRKRVARLMHLAQLHGIYRRHGKRRRPMPAVHDDLVRRRFVADAPNRLWLTDITEHPTAEGKLYCCLIKDLFSNRIVGYSINERMTKELAVNALRSALARRRFVGTVIVHSDRGSQFRSRDFVAVLKAAGLSGSMGRVAAAGDNAAMESFNSLLQKNVLNRQQWKTRDDLRYAIIHWVEHTYNRRRRQRRLGRLTPVEYELAFTNEAA